MLRCATIVALEKEIIKHLSDLYLGELVNQHLMTKISHEIELYLNKAHADRRIDYIPDFEIKENINEVIFQLFQKKTIGIHSIQWSPRLEWKGSSWSSSIVHDQEVCWKEEIK